MVAKSTRQCVLFEDVFAKPVHVALDAESMSSDGGLALLAALDRGTGLTRDLLIALVDARDGTRIEYTFEELFGQRCLGIAQAYSDGNDAARLSSDPMLKLALGRDPVSGADLASQATISRFENAITARQAVAMGRRFGGFVINRLARRHRRARVVTIDLDSTVDPTHGNQQLTLFNGFYDSWCYLPLVGFISIDGDPEQYLFHARLRPGNSRDVRGVAPLLRRTVGELRRKFRKAKVRVRADGGFYHPMLLDLLEELGVDYAVAMPKNAALARIAEPWMKVSRTLGKRSGETQTLYGEGQYRAGSWPRERRVVCKAEVLYYPGRSVKDNERFVVTNRSRLGPENTYAWYCQRGDSENRIKELKLDLAVDRTSCSRFVANQFRVLLTAAAYALFPGAPLATPQHGSRPLVRRATEEHAPQGRRPGHQLGAPRRLPPTHRPSLGRSLAACRPRVWCSARLTRTAPTLQAAASTAFGLPVRTRFRSPLRFRPTQGAWRPSTARRRRLRVINDCADS